MDNTLIVNKSDHDLLIELKATFDAFMGRYDSDIVQLKDGYTTKMNDHEVRIKTLEKISDQVDPIGSFKEFQTLKQDFRDWKTTANSVRIIMGGVGGVIFYLLTQIPAFLHLTGILK